MTLEEAESFPILPHQAGIGFTFREELARECGAKELAGLENDDSKFQHIDGKGGKDSPLGYARDGLERASVQVICE